MKEKTLILSGIRPTGKLHIGNYFGALKHFGELQNTHSCYFFIADLHSLNEPFDPKKKYGQILEQTADFLASGLDPKKSVIFVQSRVPEHTQLAIILSNVIPVSYLFRMTQFKEKSESKQDSVNSGLLYYPVLMAADILLYKPALIPVGDDQTQHVELARDVAGFFNKRFGKIFSEPKPLYTQNSRIMSLVSPEKKMSKSLGDAHCIYLDDTEEIIFQKLKNAPTDLGDAQSPGAKNLLNLAKIFFGRARYQKYLDDAKGKLLQYAELKKELAQNIAEYFKTFREKKSELMQTPEKLEDMLANGAKKAQLAAKKTLEEVKRKVGIIR